MKALPGCAMRRGRKTETAASRRARKEFTLSVLERSHCEVQQIIPHQCGGGCMDAAHVLPKRYVKKETNLWDEHARLDAMWDTDNALCACRTGHNLLDSARHCGVTAADLPEKAVSFAERHGWMFELEREYGVD